MLESTRSYTPLNPYSHFVWTGKTPELHGNHTRTPIAQGVKVNIKIDESMEYLLTLLFKKFFNRNLEKGMQK